MFAPSDMLIPGFALCAALLLGAPSASAQPPPQPPSHTLGAAPATAAKKTPPTPPQAAPRPAVKQEGGKPRAATKPPPVLKPSRPSHALPPRKPAKPATKLPGAPPAAKSEAAAGIAAGAAAAAGIEAATAPATPPGEPLKVGSSTNMPLPRFAALRSDEVNLRAGPGTRYPISWVYRRRDLPVRIEREFEFWRLIRDQDGIRGWVHQATLTGRRSFVVTGKEQTLRRQDSAESAPVARLQPGVVGHIRSCETKSDWCQMQVGGYRGWLKRDAFWGALPGEAIN